MLMKIFFKTKNIFLNRYVFLIFGLSLYLIYLTNDYIYRTTNLSKCYKNNTLIENDVNFIYLDDVLLHQNKKPTPGKSIFFHETSCSIDGTIKLNARQACAIESAAKMNPTWTIFVLFASPVGYYNNTKPSPIIESLLQYTNVNFRNVNLWTYAKNTPVEKWLKNGAIFHSEYMNSHISDLLRYLSLYKYGGTYLDLDVIVKINFDTLKPNYAGAESDDVVAAGIINLEHNNVGHAIAEMCVRDFELNYDGNDWGNNGPGVITRVLQTICLTKITKLMQPERCNGFRVHSVDKIYAIKWKNWKYFFDQNHVNDVLKMTKNSIIIHVWNNFSKYKRIPKGSGVPYELLAEQYCPKVYSSCGEYF